MTRTDAKGCYFCPKLMCFLCVRAFLTQLSMSLDGDIWFFFLTKNMLINYHSSWTQMLSVDITLVLSHMVDIEKLVTPFARDTEGWPPVSPQKKMFRSTFQSIPWQPANSSSLTKMTRYAQLESWKTNF